MTRETGGGQGTDEGTEYVQPWGLRGGEAVPPTFSWEAPAPTAHQGLWSPQEAVSTSSRDPCDQPHSWCRGHACPPAAPHCPLTHAASHPIRSPGQTLRSPERGRCSRNSTPGTPNSSPALWVPTAGSLVGHGLRQAVLRSRDLQGPFSSSPQGAQRDSLTQGQPC